MSYQHDFSSQKVEFNEFKKEMKSAMVQVLDELNSLKQKTVFADEWLDNKEASKKLRVGLRTMQNYRDKGLLSFSQVGGKVYYKASDIQKMLESHYVPGFNRKLN